jgi:hypothetical protein
VNRWRTLAPAIVAASCAQHCAPRVVDAVVWVGAHDAGDTDGAGDATLRSDTGSEANVSGGTTFVWPDDAGHTANSDPWIAQNHDKIRLMQPQVLLLDFANEFVTEDGGTVEAGYDLQTIVQPLIDEHVEAFKVASQYQGYKNPSAPAFLQYRVVKTVDLRDQSGSVNSSTLPTSSNSSGVVGVDYGQLNGVAFANLIGIEDTDHPGTYLTLCQLFEKGIINEVWGMAADPLHEGDPPTVKFASFVETKQAYDVNNVPTGQQVCTSILGDPCIAETLTCSVSVRFFDFNPGRGAGCHLFASGLQWPQYVTTGVLPALQEVAQTFFNFDFVQRFQAPFASFFGPCPEDTDGGTCIDWTTPAGGPFTGAVSGPLASQSFSFSPLTAGCGNVVFPPNATAYSVQAGDLPVLSSCENYGLHNGSDGGDRTTPYTNARIDRLSPPNRVSDCGGAQPAYLLESMPGLGTSATAADGTSMKNWWVYLFY